MHNCRYIKLVSAGGMAMNGYIYIYIERERERERERESSKSAAESNIFLSVERCLCC
jgi:hypothetical protein